MVLKCLRYSRGYLNRFVRSWWNLSGNVLMDHESWYKTIVSGKPAYCFKDKRPHEDQSWFSLMMTLNVEKEQLTEFILFDRKRFHDIRFHNSEKLPSFKRIPLIRSPVLIGKCLIGLSKSRIERWVQLQPGRLGAIDHPGFIPLIWWRNSIRI